VVVVLVDDEFKPAREAAGTGSEHTMNTIKYLAATIGITSFGFFGLALAPVFA
jgi:hypothetical protein